MNFTFEDFEREARNKGLYEEFSAADLNLARQNPDVGMSLLSYKNDYRNATTDDMRAMANTAANGLRSSYGGYTGGTMGSSYYKNQVAPSDYKKPEYTSPYADQISGLLGKVQGSTFDYDHSKDPSFSAYKKQYAREGDRATRDAIGSAASMTGGIPSTAAVTAGAQAGQYYASQLSDKIPELRQQAYNEYMQEKSADLAILDALRQLETNEYSKYTNDRNFDYSKLLDDINVDMSREDTQYGREQADKLLERENMMQVAMDLAALGDYSLYNQLFGGGELSDQQMELLKKGWAAKNPGMNWSLYGASYGGGGGGNTALDNTPRKITSNNSTTTVGQINSAKVFIERELANGKTLDAIGNEIEAKKSSLDNSAYLAYKMALSRKGFGGETL